MGGWGHSSLNARYLMPHGLADTLCGSPLYMAPEIIQNKKYDAKVLEAFDYTGWLFSICSDLFIMSNLLVILAGWSMECWSNSVSASHGEATFWWTHSISGCLLLFFYLCLAPLCLSYSDIGITVLCYAIDLFSFLPFSSAFSECIGIRWTKISSRCHGRLESCLYQSL